MSRVPLLLACVLLAAGCESRHSHSDGSTPSEDFADADPDSGATDGGDSPEDTGIDDAEDGRADEPESDATEPIGPDPSEQVDADVPSGDDASVDSNESGTGDASVDASVNPPVGTGPCGGPAPTWDVLLSAGTLAGQVAIDGDRLLVGSAGGWTLWQPSTSRQIAGGYAHLAVHIGAPGGAIDLVRDKFLVSRGDIEVEIRAAADGGVLAVFDMAFLENVEQFDGKLPRLSADASYVWQQTARELLAWSLDGELLFRRSGYYTHAWVFAAQNELLVAQGPAGDNVIERVALDGTPGTATTFAGTFGGFFDDSARFLAYDSAATTIYSPGGVPLQVIPSRGSAWGNGDLVAVADSVYRIGEPQPIATYDIRGWDVLSPLRRRGMRGYYPYDEEFKIVSLLGGAPSLATHQLPTRASRLNFASSPSGSWATGLVGVPHWSTGGGAPLVALAGCGSIRAVAGCAAGAVAVATTDGLVRIFRLDGPAPSLVRAITAPSDDISLSSDGSTLLSIGETLRLYRLPGGELAYEAPRPQFWALAAGAERLAQGVCSDAASCSLNITDFAGSPAIPAPISFTSGGSWPFPRIALSPDGRGLVIVDPSDWSSSIYQDGVVTGVSAAASRGWLGSSALLLQPKHPTSLGDPIVSNLMGATLRTLLAPTYMYFRPIDESHYYDTYSDAVYSAQDGHLVWQGDTPRQAEQQADIAGRYRARVDSNRVRLAPWR